MTRVDFYVLTDERADAHLRFACRLTEQAHADGHQLFLCVADTNAGAQLDGLLWTFRQGSFVPHGRIADLDGDNDTTPVVIGSTEPPLRFDDVLINLSDDVPGFFSRFQRSVEIVTPANRQAARARYRFYQDRGYPLETHNIK